MGSIAFKKSKERYPLPKTIDSFLPEKVDNKFFEELDAKFQKRDGRFYHKQSPVSWSWDGFEIPPRDYLYSYLTFFLKEHAVWRPEYDAIADWLGDNKKLGLYCFGSYGLGKTLLCYQIIPLFLHEQYGFQQHEISRCTALEFNTYPEKYMNDKILIVDEIGSEDLKSLYGEKRMYVSELVDNAERNGNLLIFTSNLNSAGLIEKYGDRTYDRIRSIMKVVQFQGESLRSHLHRSI